MHFLEKLYLNIDIENMPTKKLQALQINSKAKNVRNIHLQVHGDLPDFIRQANNPCKVINARRYKRILAFPNGNGWQADVTKTRRIV